VTFTVVHPGVLTTVQDTGRVGYAHFGVARSGGMDAAAMRLANRLVGNTPETAVLEAVGGGLALQANGEVIVAVTGAYGPVDVSGRQEGRGVGLRLAAGDVLTLGQPVDGVRSYVAIRGGVDIEPVLGSRSHDQLGALGPAPLDSGDELPVGTASSEPVCFEQVPLPPIRRTVRVLPGPRRDWLAPTGWASLLNQHWVVQPSTNRTGLRLGGDPLAHRAGELPSEGMAPGFVQLPPDGQPIILGPDCGVTGGYPVIAVVAASDRDRLGQLAPGEVLRFS
jgi:biotin-dependent carboxylase-like uncharacterized protein